MHNIIIIGLPGSGKTTLMNQFPLHLQFDDFISTMYDGKLIKERKQQKPVCICDPRLCNYELFKRYIEPHFDPSITEVILFMNDPEKCLRNIKSRDDIIPRKGVEKTIQKLSLIYNLNKYDKYKIKIYPVFSEEL